MRHPRLTVEQFLAWETSQYDRHEFWRGEAFAMVDGGRAHNLVSLNLALSLKTQLRGTPWAVFIEGVKLQVGHDAVFYPDVMATRDPLDQRNNTLAHAPALVAEVLCPATEAFDRGAKFAACRRLPSLLEYVLIDPDLFEVLVFRREGPEGRFTLHDFSAGPALELASLPARVGLEELFDGVWSGGPA